MDADHFDAAADRLVMLADRVASVPAVQREVAEVPSTLTSTPSPATPAIVEALPVAPIATCNESAKPMTADEVCKRLGCSGTLLSQLREHGIVAVAGTNGAMGRTLFDRESVEAARGTWAARLAKSKAACAKVQHDLTTDNVMPHGTLTAVETAEVLGCSRAYVTLMLQRGVIKGEKVATSTGGSYWRIDKASVDAVSPGEAWRRLLSEAMARVKRERVARLGGAPAADEAPVVEPTAEPPATVAVVAPVSPVAASLHPVDEADHDGPQSAVAKTPDPVVEAVAPVADTTATEPKPKRAPVHRQKATNDRDADDPFPDGPVVTPLALVMRWGLTMRQLRAIVSEGWLRANGDGDVLEHDAQWFEKGTGPGSLRQWKKDHVGGYGRPAGVHVS